LDLLLLSSPQVDFSYTQQQQQEKNAKKKYPVSPFALTKTPLCLCSPEQEWRRRRRSGRSHDAFFLLLLLLLLLLLPLGGNC
jgi:hypothetical protein